MIPMPLRLWVNLENAVWLSPLKDMEILMDGIPLDKVSTSMTINSCCYYLGDDIAAAEKQGVKPDKATRDNPE